MDQMGVRYLNNKRLAKPNSGEKGNIKVTGKKT